MTTSDTVNDRWSANMSWKHVTHREEEASITLQIEPMMSRPDLVYLPDIGSWRTLAPPALRNRREEILVRLKATQWNRELEWYEMPTGFASDQVVPGSLESTPGGAELARMNVFGPGSELTREEARRVWLVAAQRFAAAASGRVTIFADKTVPDSVFQLVELPALRANPRVDLDFR